MCFVYAIFLVTTASAAKYFGTQVSLLQELQGYKDKTEMIELNDDGHRMLYEKFLISIAII